MVHKPGAEHAHEILVCNFVTDLCHTRLSRLRKVLHSFPPSSVPNHLSERRLNLCYRCNSAPYLDLFSSHWICAFSFRPGSNVSVIDSPSVVHENVILQDAV